MSSRPALGPQQPRRVVALGLHRLLAGRPGHDRHILLRRAAQRPAQVLARLRVGRWRLVARGRRRLAGPPSATARVNRCSSRTRSRAPFSVDSTAATSPAGLPRPAISARNCRPLRYSSSGLIAIRRIATSSKNSTSIHRTRFSQIAAARLRLRQARRDQTAPPRRRRPASDRASACGISSSSGRLACNWLYSGEYAIDKPVRRVPLIACLALARCDRPG